MLLELNLDKIIQVWAKLLVRRVEESKSIMTKNVDKNFGEESSGSKIY